MSAKSSPALPLRPALDVASLPTVVFGHRSLMWWGTVSFMIIEGWTLALCVATYFYVRPNLPTWPPPRTPVPSLLIPTINLVVMLVSLAPAAWAKRRARRLDRNGAMIGLFVGGAFGLAILVMRWYELWALNVRWDTNVYGSAAWIIVGFHYSLLLLDVGDTIGLGGMFALTKMPPHFFSDVCDNSYYWYFTVAVWIPIYLIVYVGPRFLR